MSQLMVGGNSFDYLFRAKALQDTAARIQGKLSGDIVYNANDTLRHALKAFIYPLQRPHIYKYNDALRGIHFLHILPQPLHYLFSFYIYRHVKGLKNVFSQQVIGHVSYTAGSGKAVGYNYGPGPLNSPLPVYTRR